MSKKGKIKNGNNKAKHTKLLNQKKNKIREEKLLNKQRLRALIVKSNLYKDACPCGSNKTFGNCCAIAHNNIEEVSTAEQLMRSRYTAYALGNIEYLMSSHHSLTRPNKEQDEILNWTKSVIWLSLEILNSSNGSASDIEGTVEFKAHFEEVGATQVIHEHSKFVKENGHWVYLGEV
ncbi:MAG: SEC-C domain-containing protein [Flavobacteriaceae bacterium]|nr:SEC-C domain-containing protein [Flavobacteriaceae bacterium]